MRSSTLYLFFVCILLGASFARSQSPFSWRGCDKASVPFTPKEVNLSPDPPVIGKEVFFTIKGDATRNVAGGTLEVLVSFAGTPIFQESEDLCGKTTCPIKKGPISISYSQELPPIAPPGDYEVQVVARDPAGTELMCVIVDFSLVPAYAQQPTLEGARKRKFI